MNRYVLTGTLLCAATMNASTLLHGQSKTPTVERDDLHMIAFSDGSQLEFFVRVFFPQEAHSAGVVVTLCNKKGELIWSTRFTQVDHVPGKTCYYGLVNVTEDHIFLFTTWNARHCTFDKKTGQIVGQGKGDDVLKRYDSLLPMKLTLIPGRSTGYDMSLEKK